MSEIETLKNEFFNILELLHKEINEMKQEIMLLKQNDINEYNKLLSNYTPLKEKTNIQKITIHGVEYIMNNNILFDEMGVIVGNINIYNEINMLNNSS
jgi:hypothetical protein